MDRPEFELPPVPEYEPTSDFLIPSVPVRLCDKCGADGATSPPGTSRRLCLECAEQWLEHQKTLCISCKHEQRAPARVYCQPCLDRKEERRREEQQRQWQKISGTRHKMCDWDLSTFPADDAAGKAALKGVEPWLWAHAHHRLLNGALVPISEENPEPDIDHDDHPIWGYFHDPQHLGLNLYIWGPVGSGKTGLAWSLLKARVHLAYDHEESDEYPAWANVVDLLDKAKAAMSAGDPASPIRDLYEASVLVLDDLGAERPTDWARDAIASLVQHRHTRDIPTVITSNYAPAALVKRLGHDDPMIGQRIVSRLVEHCIVVKLDRPDLRVAKKAA